MSSRPESTQSTILVVDDTPQNVLILGTVLSHHRYGVVAARSGEEALTSEALKECDVVLLDVLLAGPDGYEVSPSAVIYQGEVDSVHQNWFSGNSDA